VSKASEWFTYTHLLLFIIFSILAILIFLGVVGPSKEFIGSKFLIPEEGSFPRGFKIFFLNGLVMLLNFQGVEIVGLSASETVNPNVEIPKTMKKMASSVSLLYIVPMFLLTLIYPWNNPVIEGSIFSVALEAYGFKKIGILFSVLIVVGALSVCNSGLYAASRALHAMSFYRMIPSYFKKLSQKKMPLRCSVLACIFIWIFLIADFVLPSAKLYEHLLSLAGFSGTIPWLAICITQLVKRRRLSEEQKINLNYKSRFYPYGTWLAILLILFSMLFILFDSSLRQTAIVGIMMFIIPTGIYAFFGKKRRLV
jgi:AAT family amino acid transporter